jgi:hypothetical protein
MDPSFASRWRQSWTDYADGLAARLADAQRLAAIADIFRDDLPNDSEAMIRHWLVQSAALAEWEQLTAAENANVAARATLRRDCESVIAKLEGSVQRSPLISMLIPTTRDWQQLGAEVLSVLRRCCDSMNQVDLADPLPALQLSLDRAIAQMPASWPPKWCRRFQFFDVTIGDDFTSWQHELEVALPDLVPATAAQILLVRCIMAQGYEVPIGAIRELLPASEINVERIDDPSQPAEWFDLESGPVTVAEVVQTGLALRTVGRPWICFPRGRQRVPPPVPESLAHVLDLAPALGEPIADRVRQCRASLHDGAFDVAVVQLFVDFWGDLGEDARERDPSAAEEFANGLNDLLAHECRLYPFRPANFQDHPEGWVLRLPGRAMVTGRVRRIVRPGLHDDQHQLRVPALVEVE